MTRHFLLPLVVLAIGCASAFAAPVIIPTPASYYPFDTDLVDVVGGHNGTSANETHATILGRMALDTNPSNSHVQVISATGAWAGDAVADDQITFSFWFLDTQRANSTTFKGVSPEASGSQRGASAHTPWGNGTIYWDTAGCCGSPGQRITTGSGDTNDGEWHHFAFVKDGGAKAIWKDGVILNSQASGANPLLDFTDLWIGSAISGAERVTAYIDDFAVFDVALTAEQIEALANGQAIIPEPATMALLGLAACGLGGYVRRRRRA